VLAFVAALELPVVVVVLVVVLVVVDVPNVLPVAAVVVRGAVEVLVAKGFAVETLTSVALVVSREVVAKGLAGADARRDAETRLSNGREGFGGPLGFGADAGAVVLAVGRLETLAEFGVVFGRTGPVAGFSEVNGLALLLAIGLLADVV